MSVSQSWGSRVIVVVDSDFKGGCELIKAGSRKAIWKHVMREVRPLGMDQRFIG